MQPWEAKAHSIIAALCLAEWKRANLLPSGKTRRKHVPYSVPDTARDLIDALGKRDEEKAKAIFLYDYEARRVQR